MRPDASRFSRITMSEKSASWLLPNGFSISMRTVPVAHSSQKLTEKSWSMTLAVLKFAGQLASWACACAAPKTRKTHTSARQR